MVNRPMFLTSDKANVSIKHLDNEFSLLVISSFGFLFILCTLCKPVSYSFMVGISPTELVVASM